MEKERGKTKNLSKLKPLNLKWKLGYYKKNNSVNQGRHSLDFSLDRHLYGSPFPTSLETIEENIKVAETLML